MSAQPETIDKFATGLVQYQQNQILQSDAFSQSLNAFTYLNTVRRREAWNLIGRLSRTLTSVSLGTSGASPWTFTIYSQLATPITGEPNAAINIGSVVITVGTEVFTDQGNGNLSSSVVGDSGTINYSTGSVTLITTNPPATAASITFSYFPSLPVMGIFDQYANNNLIQNCFMDTKYTYSYADGIFIQNPIGAVWNLSDFLLPSPLNYYFDNGNNKLFWITNIQGTLGIPIQYSNFIGSAVWYPFSPPVDTTEISPPDPPATVNRLWQAKFLVPFRGRLYAFNTYEGETLAGSANYCNRIRASAATTPFTYPSAIITTVNTNAWNDTIPGQGYFLDLPTNEEIEGVTQVMNQIIIKTSTKTYVLTHTGMSIAPFKVDLVDDNEGTGSGFSAVNMGSYVQNIGTRSIDNTSPTSVEAIDQKIINFVFDISRDSQGLGRIYGVRDYMLRCNSYIFPFQAANTYSVTYPNRRLIYNYENKTWAIYQDSLTALGYFRESTSVSWKNATWTWEEDDSQWYVPSGVEPYTCGGNQQGFIGYLDSGVQQEVSLQITGITKVGGNQACIFTSPLNNIDDLTVAQISGIVGDWSYLNGTIGQVNVIDQNTFTLYSLDPVNNQFTVPVFIPASDMGSYIGGGLIQLRYNFFIMTKAFNFLREGQSIHIPYIDAIVNVNQGVDVQVSAYSSLNTANPTNFPPENTNTDAIFGGYISLGNPTQYPINQSNNRALINQRSNMTSFSFSLDNATLASDNFFTPFVMSSLTIWKRKAGRPLSPLGGG